MMRLLAAVSALLVCTLFVGCASETHEGLIKETISAMGTAANDVKMIKNRVDDAIKKVEKGDTTKLDLTEATKLTEKLKGTGEEFQRIKRKVEQVRSLVSDDDRKKNAESSKGKLNDAFKDLLDQKEQLRQALEKAEKAQAQNAKAAVDDLRKKIVDAESPFEALARQ